MTDVRNILVTGCSSGIGRCVAMGLQARGYRVFATARSETDLAALDALGLESVELHVDDPDSVATAAEAVLQRTDGRVYGLFNNAAYGLPGAVEDISWRALEDQLRTNVVGWHDLTRRLIPSMRRHGEGRIVQNSSVLGLVAMPYRGAYNCSKYAIEGLSDTLRLELHGTGIHVSLIEPGPIRSRFRGNAYAKFLEYVDMDRSVHRDRYAGMIERLRHEGDVAPFTLPPEAVLDKVVHALESRRPRPRYPVTVPTHLFGLLRRLLGTRQLDWLLRRASGGGRR
jgi:NAD(P)-dependent dehydrogenase (short-subunit alcohol dehydrogenase family)